MRFRFSSLLFIAIAVSCIAASGPPLPPGVKGYESVAVVKQATLLMQRPAIVVPPAIVTISSIPPLQFDLLAATTITATNWVTLTNVVGVAQIPKAQLNMMTNQPTGSIHVAWDAEDGVQSFKIFYGATNGTFTNSISADGSATNATIYGLEPDQVYAVAAMAVGTNGAPSEFTPQVIGTAFKTVPPVVVLFKGRSTATNSPAFKLAIQ